MPDAILEAVDLRDARILEVGAGDGRLTFQYASKSRSVIGIDTAELDIRPAAAAPRMEIRGQVQFLWASATALPFSAEQFEIGAPGHAPRLRCRRRWMLSAYRKQ